MASYAIKLLSDDKLLAEIKKKLKARALEFDLVNILPIYEKMYEETLEEFHKMAYFIFHAMSQKLFAKNMKTSFKKISNFTFIKTINHEENEISYAIIGIAMELHKNIGAGLLESAYEKTLLVYDLKRKWI